MKDMQDYWALAKLFLALSIVAFCRVTIGQQPPSGSFQYAFTAPQGLPLWNFSGSYVLPSYYEGFEFDNNSQLHLCANGKIIATYDGADTGSPALAGTITGAGSTLKMRLSSTPTLTEYFSGAKIKNKYSLLFDPSARLLKGTDRVTQTSVQLVMDCPNSFWECNNYKMQSVTSSSIQPITVAVPETADGNWTLNLEIVPEGNKLSGSASITFSNGEAFQFGLRGSYAPKKQKTTVILRGAGIDKGATLLVSIADMEMRIVSIRGIVGGQRIHFP